VRTNPEEQEPNMHPPLHTLIDEQCKGDGLCVQVCPKDVLEIREGKARTIEAAVMHCLRCGQCVAVCPNEALALDGLAATELERARAAVLPFDDLLGLLRARRSVRTFADRPVERALVERVLEAAATAPPGFPPHATEVLVIDRRDDLDALVRTLVASYDKLLAITSNRLGRLYIRLRRGAETAHALHSHVLQIVRWDNERFRAKGVDRYTYGAPVVLLFHADRWVAGYQESTMVTATYAMLAAHALGLGATMLSIVPPALNNVARELSRSYGIPDDNVVVVALVLGHPKHKYRRTIRRPLKSVRFLRD
jgi:nitroreductase/NAD-dependent dihydropyrimidine dehydrogenase PreA subunit